MKEPGLAVPMPDKDFRPMRRAANAWPHNALTGAMTEYRTVQDFGAPKGWPPSAPASATHTASVTDPGTPLPGDAPSASLPELTTATRRGPRRNPAK